VNRAWPTRLGEFGASLEVINVTNNENVFGYDYFRDKNAAGQVELVQANETWFSIFPTSGSPGA